MNATALPDEPRTVTGGGGPTYVNEVDRRLEILETRFDTMLPTLATKHDLDKLRGDLLVELHKAIHGQTKWMIGLFLSLLIAMLGFNFAILNAIRSLQQAPAASTQSTRAVAEQRPVASTAMIWRCCAPICALTFARRSTSFVATLQSRPRSCVRK